MEAGSEGSTPSTVAKRISWPGLILGLLVLTVSFVVLVNVTKPGQSAVFWHSKWEEEYHHSLALGQLARTRSRRTSC